MHKILYFDDNNKIINIYSDTKENNKNILYKLAKYIKEQNDNTANIAEENDKIIIDNNDIFQYELFFDRENNINIKINKHKDKVAFNNFKYLEEEFFNYINGINIIETQKIVKKINASIKDNMWLDFMINDYKTDLHIVGSNDLSCYYDIEIIFKNVIHIECDTHFNACPSEYDVFRVDNNYKDYNIKINIHTDTKTFHIICESINYNNNTVRYDYNYNSLYSADKENIIKKYGLIKENDKWYQEKENSHKALIFTDKFFNTNDTIGIIFRIYKLCFAKVKYFRAFYYKFEYYKYDYKKGFIETELWDVEFFKHIDSGLMIDLRYLQSITVYDDFVNFCNELDNYSK